jgi:hypothetical protein
MKLSMLSQSEEDRKKKKVEADELDHSDLRDAWNLYDLRSLIEAFLESSPFIGSDTDDMNRVLYTRFNEGLESNEIRLRIFSLKLVMGNHTYPNHF